ncbi:MAG TPA: hypothetical protein VFN50_09460 [Acidimicrobiales bacterium]|nr:hypothetical protein [Acidimicrobiales bacterium]
MRQIRLVLGLLLSSAALSVLAFVGPLSTPSTADAATANSHWVSCNDYGVGSTPQVVWYRIKAAATKIGDIPSSFWWNITYRHDIAKVICYESSFDWHARNAGQYGWYQMSSSLMSSEYVSWHEYWYGTKYHPAGWYQCVAGERYILHRYGNPANAWHHEESYGWY